MAKGLRGTEMPTLKSLFAFLENHIKGLSAIGLSKQGRTQKSNGDSKGAHNGVRTSKCSICEESHSVFKCPKFGAMTLEERVDAVGRARLCFRCLFPGHMIKACTTKFKCR